jgi:tetratricopeptide (TPR) repeat protein
MVAPGVAGGDKKKAKTMADEIAAIDPARGQLALARIALAEKDSATADARFREAARVDPKSYDGCIGAASWFAYSRENWKEAESAARAALEVGPDRIGSYAVLAAVYVHGERWSDLDGILDSAERAMPDNLTAHYTAAVTLITEKKDAPRAERYLRKYLGVEPEPNRPSFARAHWLLAGALEQQGKKPDAMTELQTAIKLDPDLEDAKKDLKRLKRA